MHDVVEPHCPAVPLPGSGTAGQSASATDFGGTPSGTVTETSSLKALAQLVLQRDKARDTERDRGQSPPEKLSRTLGQTGKPSGTFAPHNGRQWQGWI